MRTKVYVDGAILITTPYFKHKGGGTKFGIPNADVDIITPTDSINGIPCLKISGKNVPTIFKEYYAKEFFTTNTPWASIFHRSIDDCFSSLNERIDEVNNLIKLNDICDKTRQILYRLSLVSIVAALDTLISDLVIFATSRDNELFLKVIDLLYSGNSKAKLLERILHMWCDNTLDSAEQEVFETILKTSYSSSKEIKQALKQIFGIDCTISKELEKIITIRHIIAHRNGRQKDGNYLEFTQDELFSIISEVSKFGEGLKEPIYKWCLDTKIDEIVYE